MLMVYLCTASLKKKTGPSNCGNFDARLVGGDSEREGRVEICYSRVWETVCDYGWDQVDAIVVCRQLGYQRALPTNNSRFGDGEGPILFENVRCNQIHSNLSRCVDFQHIGTLRHCTHTAGVICEGMMSTSTNQVSTATVYAITANMSHDNTYKSHGSAANSSVVAILGTVGALIMTIAIAVITFVLITRLRLKFKVNR